MKAKASSGHDSTDVQVGTRTGPNTAKSKNKAHDAKASAIRLTNIPFPRDEDFVECGNLLSTVQQRCSVPGSWTALVGRGGVGKTQLTVEYSYRVLESSPKTWVLWAHASNTVRFEQSFRDIADLVKIEGRKNLKTNIFKLVYDWLLNDKNGKWLLILDDLDDADALEVQQTHPSSDSPRRLPYLPQCHNGSILFTSRNVKAASKFVERSVMIPVKRMGLNEAVTLFKRKAAPIADSKDIPQLVEALEFMPLAIVQAASYVWTRELQASVRQYFDEFSKRHRNKTTLLDDEGGDFGRDWEANSSILITWQILFEYIQQMRPSAANLLFTMSFFDRQGIPEALLRYGGDDERSVSASDESQHSRIRRLSDLFRRHKKFQRSMWKTSHPTNAFEEDLLLLKDLSLISISESGKSLEMHRLVQKATQDYLRATGQSERWNRRFLQALTEQFQEVSLANWMKCHRLLPHVHSAMTRKPHERGSLKLWASILYNAARYMWATGRKQEAEVMLRQAMNARQIALGHAHPETLVCSIRAAHVYLYTGRPEEAEELFRQSLDTIKRAFGSGHRLAINAMRGLSRAYYLQSRYEDAEAMQLQIINHCEKTLGSQHQVTLGSIETLAETYRKQGRLEKAEKLSARALDVRAVALKKAQQEALHSMAAHAKICIEQGRYTEAEKVLVQAVMESERVFGNEHPHTLNYTSSLARALYGQRRFEEAGKLEVQTLEGFKRVRGPESKDAVIGMKNLAMTRKEQGQLADAIKLMEESVQIEIAVKGVDHPEVISHARRLEKWKKKTQEN